LGQDTLAHFTATASAPGSAQRVDFVKEDNGGGDGARSSKYFPHSPLALSHPFTEQFRSYNGVDKLIEKKKIS
jgi:hypothetical protein